MWKYNIHNIGDIVSHHEAPTIEFQVCNILKPEIEDFGKYLYSCRIADNQNKDAELFNYLGSDLFFVRKGTKQELNRLLSDAIKEEEYERNS